VPHSKLDTKKRKEKKNYVGSETTPYIEGKGDILA